MKNKTVAVWITLLAGPLGLHRLYLLGKFDYLSWLRLLPTLAGAYGVMRAREIGVDDPLSWLLMPWLGFSASASAATALYYGLMETEKWNQRFNPQSALDDAQGQSGWLTVAGLVASLFLGAIVLIASIAFTFQRYFEYQAQTAAEVSSVPLPGVLSSPGQARLQTERHSEYATSGSS